MALQGTFIVNQQQIDALTRQINNATDCAALSLIFENYLNTLEDIIRAKIQTQGDILEKILPLLKLPKPTPRQILKWIKKFVGGTIMPQLEAQINLIIQLVSFINSLRDLSNAITGAQDRLERCIEFGIMGQLRYRIEVQINNLTQPIDDALTRIELAQLQLEVLLENPLNQRIVTDTLENFLTSAQSAFPAIEQQVNDFAESDFEDEVFFSGNVVLGDTSSLVISDGVIIGVAANTG